MHEDTDYVTVTLSVCGGVLQTQTRALGNVNNGTHPIGLTFNNVAVGVGQTAVLTYAIVNNGQNTQSEVITALEDAGTALAQKGAVVALAAMADPSVAQTWGP